MTLSKIFDFNFLYRKKPINNEEQNGNNKGLSRVLGLTDISAIGISSTLGSGIYVLAGSVIAKYSGPSIMISFIIAGIATFLSGLSYAELGARVPKSGSAYAYIYVTIGEFVAFMMGWDLILEYIIGTASVSNALSQYIDKITGRKIQAFLSATLPINSPFLGPYPDLVAFGLVVIATCIMLNLSWIDSFGENQTCFSSSRCGNGGFMPFGISGLITGAAKCFYAFIGFDAIASTGEELKNPKRNMPLGILITLLTTAALYCGISFVITLMVPYYVIDSDTPLPHAFEYANLDWAKKFVSFGAILSLGTCLYAGMFPMPRIIYSMASDGLLFSVFAKILPKFHTPYIASIFSGLCAGFFAAIFDLNELVEMMSIGTLIAYTLVSLCVLILRYKPEEDVNEKVKLMSKKDPGQVIDLDVDDSDDNFLRHLFSPTNKTPSRSSSMLVNYLTFLILIHLIIVSIVISNYVNFGRFVDSVIVILFFNVFLLGLIIWRQPQNTLIQTFQAPLVPLTPILSSMINIYLMTTLSLITWFRFLIWFILGFTIYMIYGASHSKENKNKNQRRWLTFILKNHQIGEKEIEEKVEITKF
ncbi:high affinity cationic amino acid transporter 1 [Brachionus plicatilis]|uniref:High affinity cationic amino acid transporter 1 n=1 Tax=Brachionus plicatilis TaxID=10195 RepID=A0A3M7T9J3_BRAPC|nr:high affinity cationic amino acid transporter 1 [Brachionus plicatilis]